MNDSSKGKLYLIATPIGNIRDITLRALDTLKEVDLVAAEDTRVTRRLLDHYDIKKPLMSYHDHTEKVKATPLCDQIDSGKSVALVSDGGMPLVSDPGYVLVQEAIARGIEIEVLPGPSASLSALLLSGMAVDRFAFEGFLSRSPSKRRKRLRQIVDEERTMIFYESPHRLIKSLRDMLLIFGNRPVAVMREITKKFEEHYRSDLQEAIAYFDEKAPRGEFVICLSGRGKELTGKKGNDKKY